MRTAATRRRRRWCRWLLGGLVLLVVAPPIAVEIGSRIGPSEDLAVALASPWLADRHGEPLLELAGPDGFHTPVDEAGLGPWLPAALIAIEDRRFSTHQGVDWPAVAVAAGQNLAAARIVRGASTITMQLARLERPRPRGLAAKFREAMRARQLERRYAKATILAAYADAVPQGGNLVGVGTGAWRWFGQRAADLDLAEAAFLAGILQGPSRLDPRRHPSRARARRDAVLAAMVVNGAITAEQATRAAARPVPRAWRPLPQANHAGALPTLLRLVGRGNGRTTLDADHQRLAARLVEAHRQRLGPGLAVAVLVVAVASGEVHAAVDSGHHAPWLSCAVQRRPAGSTLKPFLYARAFARRLAGPATRLPDQPRTAGDWRPANADGGFLGRVAAAEALAASRNLPAIALLRRLGVGDGVAVLRRLGFAAVESPARHGLALAIGGVDVGLDELAAAYRSLAIGRVAPLRWRPTTPPAVGQASPLPTQACQAVLACLADRRRSERVEPAAAALAPAWKTGTSQGRRDAWCVALTPRWLTAVWVGRPDGGRDGRLTGLTAAAPLALGLLAAIDPGGPPFAPVDLTDDAGIPALPTPEAGLRLSQPPAGSRLLVAPGDPVALRADGGVGPYTWFVDDAPLGQSPGPEGPDWRPVSGSYRLRLVDGVGAARLARVEIIASKGGG